MLLVVGLLLHATGELAAQVIPGSTTVPAPDAFAPIRERLYAMVESRQLASVTVGVMRHGRTVWLESFGYADVERQEPATPMTSYAVGSMSKSLSGTLALSMDVAGILDLDQPANDYLASPLGLHDGTVWTGTSRQALQMVAGIPHGSASTSLEAPALSSTHVLHAHGRPILQADRYFEYSNYSMGLVQVVLERAAGQPFRDLLSRYLAEPLALASLGIFGDTSPGVAVATRHTTGFRPVASRFHPEAAAGLRISGQDLLEYARFHMGLRPGPIPASRLPEVVRGSRHAPYGLGMGVLQVAGVGRVLVTNGSIAGANSNLIMLPERGSAALILINSSTAVADPLAVELIEVLEPGFAEAFRDVAMASARRTRLDDHQGNSFDGEWTGRIWDPGRPDAWVEPVRLHVADGAARIGVAGAPATPVSRAQVGPGGELRLAPSGGWILSRLTGNGDGVGPQQLVLFPVDGRLEGYAVIPYDADGVIMAKPVALVLERATGAELAPRGRVGERASVEQAEPVDNGMAAAAPKLFAPGALNLDTRDEYGPVLDRAGTEMYFTIRRNRSGLEYLVRSTLASGMWSQPEALSFSGVSYDKEPYLSPDGTRLFFASRRPVPSGQPSGFEIWVSERINGHWMEPRHVSEVGSPGDDSYPAYIDPDERFIIHSSTRAGGAGEGDLYLTIRQGDGWAPSVHLGPAINTADYEFTPFVTLDGQYLYFSRGWGEMWRIPIDEVEALRQVVRPGGRP